MRSTLHALFRPLAKPFRRGDPETDAHDAEAELEMDEARHDPLPEAWRRDLTR